MDRIIYTFFILFISQGVFGQQVDQSLPVEYSKRKKSFDILGKANDLSLVHFSFGKDNEVHAYLPNMGLKWKRFIKRENRKQRVEKIFLRKGGFIVIFSEKEGREKHIFAKIYNLEFKADTVVYPIITLKRKFIGQFDKLYFRESEDRMKILAFHIDRNFNKNDDLYFTIFNNQMEILSKDVINIPTSQTKNKLEQVFIDNKGRIFLTIGEYKGYHSNFINKYWVLYSDDGYQNIKKIELEADGEKLFSNAVFEMDNSNNKLLAAGFYNTDQRWPMASNGLFFSNFDLENEDSLNVFYQSFDPVLVAKANGSRTQKNLERIYSYSIRDVILRSDGGALIIAESAYKTSKNPTERFNPYSNHVNKAIDRKYDYTLHFDEVLIFSINPNGEKHWENVLVKSQSSVGDDGIFSSFFLMNTGHTINIIYNDAIDPSTNLVQYKVDPEGNIDREIIFNARKSEVYMMPSLGKQISANEVIVPSLKKRELKLVKLSY